MFFVQNLIYKQEFTKPRFQFRKRHILDTLRKKVKGDPAVVAWCDYSSCFSFSKFVLWSHGGSNPAWSMQYELILNKMELMLRVDAIGLLLVIFEKMGLCL